MPRPDDLDEFLARRRAKRAQSNVLLYAGIGAGVLVLLLLAVGVIAAVALSGRGDGSGNGRPGPVNPIAAVVDPVTAGDEGETWTVSDLINHVNASGVNATVREGGTTLTGSAYAKFRFPDGSVVRVDHFGTAREAKDYAGAPSMPGDYKACWGRFGIAGDAESVEKLVGVLH